MPVNQSKLRLAPTLLSQLTGMFKLAIVLQLDSKKKKKKKEKILPDLSAQFELL